MSMDEHKKILPMEKNTQKLKILHIGPFPPPIHGMSLANTMLLEGLKKKGHNVVAIDTSTNRTLENQKCQGVFSIKKIFPSLLQILRGSTKIFFDRSYSTIYITPSQTLWGYLKYTPFILTASMRAIPVFIHIHGSFFRNMYNLTSTWKRFLINQSLRSLSGVIVLGDSLRYLFEGLLPEEKIFVCPNGVEDEVFASEDEVKEKIDRWGKDDTLRILYLSNLMKEKGILDLLEAAKILKSKNIKFHMDLAGAIEPEIKDEVEYYLRILATETTYHGIVTSLNKKHLLNKNYVFCLPTKHSLSEGQPISILEAMANGCCIVTTSMGDIKGIVDERYGFFSEKNNPERLADAILSAWKQSRSGITAWREASSFYTEKHYVERIENVLLLFRK